MIETHQFSIRRYETGVQVSLHVSQLMQINNSRKFELVYYINVNESDNWHVVHSERRGCLNRTMHGIRLGKYASASMALRSAKDIYPNVRPCFYCCN